MKVNPGEALKNYEREVRQGASPIYVREAAKFLDYASGDFSKEALVSYIKHLHDRKYAVGTIVKITLTTLRKLYRVNGIPWPLKRGEGPQLREGDTYAPALDPQLVRRMIRTSLTPQVSRFDRAILALATVYGVRRVEMAHVVQTEVNIPNRVILIRTAKQGRERWHVIPEEIVDVINIPWGRYRQQVWNVSKAYQRLERAAGIERMPEVGWHAIRRILVRLLVEAGLPALTIDSFFRWKRGGDNMQRLYYATQVVGEKSQRIEIGRLDREVDEKVFSVHPFLKDWGIILGKKEKVRG